MKTQNKYISVLGLVFLCLLMSHAHAQETSPTDSVIINVGKSKIIFLIKNQEDLETIKKYDLNAILQKLSLKLEADSSLVKTSNTEQAVSDTTIVVATSKDTAHKTDTTSMSAEIKISHEKKEKKHQFNLDLGMNNWLGDNGFPDGSGEPYGVRPFGSWYIAIASINRTQIKGPLYLEWGPNISWYNFKFQDDNTRIINNDNTTIFEEDTQYPDADFIKSKLTVVYLNFSAIPIIYFNKDDGKKKSFLGINNNTKSFRIGLGPYAGYRLDSYSKIVFRDEGREKKRNHDNFHLNNFRYGVRLQVGYKGTDLFFNYDLNPTFNDGRGPNLNTFSFGIII